MNELTQMFYLLYSLIAMLSIAVLSILAYRKSLKKVFIVFMIVAIPVSINNIYRTYRHLMLKYCPVDTYLSLHKNRRPSTVYWEMEKKKSAIWNKAITETKQIEKDYAQDVAAENPIRRLNGWWQRFLGILQVYLLPIGVIIVCTNEIKKSNHRFHSIADSARPE